MKDHIDLKGCLRFLKIQRTEQVDFFFRFFRHIEIMCPDPGILHILRHRLFCRKPQPKTGKLQLMRPPFLRSQKVFAACHPGSLQIRRILEKRLCTASFHLKAFLDDHKLRADLVSLIPTVCDKDHISGIILKELQ